MYEAALFLFGAKIGITGQNDGRRRPLLYFLPEKFGCYK